MVDGWMMDDVEVVVFVGWVGCGRGYRMRNVYLEGHDSLSLSLFRDNNERATKSSRRRLNSFGSITEDPSKTPAY
jgi:alpha-glucosidase (family GH31 glycosyl hydrolase)